MSFLPVISCFYGIFGNDILSIYILSINTKGESAKNSLKSPFFRLTQKEGKNNAILRGKLTGMIDNIDFARFFLKVTKVTPKKRDFR